jgi:hypothetical protein
MARKVEHYLLTIPLEGVNFHAYLMTNDRRQVQAAASRMMDVIEKQKLPMPMPVILETRLSTGADIVRGIVAAHMPEAAQCMAEATNFHLTAFVMSAHANPDNDCLMELH